MTAADLMRGDDDERREHRRESGDVAPGDTQAMREEIETTRMRMSDTLDEIGDRLHPQTIKDNVKDSIKQATIGRVSDMARNATDSVQRSSSGIANTVRENPVPAAMIAIGLGWMFFNGKSEGTERSTERSTERGAERGIERGTERLASSVKDKTGELADGVKEGAQDVARALAQTGRRSMGRVEKAYDANPLAMGAVALAAGLALGLAAPSTDRELRMMGGETPTFV